MTEHDGTPRNVPILPTHIREEVELDYLRREVTRLRNLTEKLLRIRPRPVWADDKTNPPDDEFRIVHYRVELRLPDRRVLHCTVGLDPAFWEPGIRTEAFGAMAERTHRAIAEMI